VRGRQFYHLPENVLIAIFDVEMKFFWCAVQFFAASLPPFGVSFCRLIVQVLLPYVKFLKRSTKVCCIFIEGRGVKASLWTVCCCQKYIDTKKCLRDTD